MKITNKCIICGKYHRFHDYLTEEEKYKCFTCCFIESMCKKIQDALNIVLADKNKKGTIEVIWHS